METNQGVPQILNNRYQLLEKIGSGGMAAVYKAQDLVLGRVVAVKLLHAGLIGDPLFLEKFRKEAHSVANLTHPNIVTVHDIGQDGDRHYIVMEYVEGTTLKQIVRNQPANRPVSVIRALDLAIQICAGLGYAHRAGLIHCDVKPQNVLVRRDDTVKVTDFGIARAMSEATSHTKELAWGTPQYFSPEQAMGKPATPASDVYSIGIILFELLTGHLPFSADNQTALALKHINEPPPQLASLNRAIAPALQEIVSKTMAKNPDERYKTAGQLGRMLSTYRQHGLSNSVSYTTVTDSQSATQQVEGAVSSPLPVEPVGNNNIPSPAPEKEEIKPEIVVVPPPPTPPSHRKPSPPPSTITNAEPTNTENNQLTMVLGIIAMISLIGLIPCWYLVADAWGAWNVFFR